MSNKDFLDLNTLIDAPTNELKQMGKGIDLPSPEELETEEQLLQTILSKEEVSYVEEEETGPSFWETLYASWMWTAPAFGACAVLIWFLVPKGPMTPDVGTVKGWNIKPTDRMVSVLMGCWDPKQKRRQRVANGGVCRPGQNASFGFVLKQSRRVYLFVRGVDGKKEMLYPSDGRRAPVWKKGFQELNIDGVKQHYPLGTKPGKLTFFALASTHVLQQKQWQSFLKKSSFDVALRELKKESRRAISLAHDTFVLHVKAQPKGK